jgi:hypothetical protein
MSIPSRQAGPALAVRVRIFVFTVASIFGIGWGIRCAAAQAQDRPWELNPGDLQAVGLHLPSYMSTVADLNDHQKRLSSRQEIWIEWNPRTGYDHPAYREDVAERSLKHDFALQQRNQNIKGNAVIGSTDLLDLRLVVVAATGTGELRGLAMGPSLLIRCDVPPVPGGPPQECHDYIQSKTTFLVGLPDDPTIDKLVLLLTHPNEKPRLEQVGVIDLTAKVAPK